MSLAIRNPTMPRALQVPELADMIISEMDKGTLTKIARVCKGWSAIALAYLWESLSDLFPLFKLLAPNGFELKDNKLVFKDLPNESNWRRFCEYSNRVKSLTVDDTDERYTHLFDTFARLRPFHLGQNGNLFPSLRTLEWKGPNELSLLTRSVLFMQPGIQTFSIHLPGTYVHTRPSSALRQYIEHSIARMPYVKELTVSLQGYMAIVEAAILQLVKGWSKTLETLTVPKYWTSTALVEALSSLPHFNTLKASPDIPGVYDPARRFQPNIPPSPKLWPALEMIELAAPFREVIQFLQKNPLPLTLTALVVYSPRMESRETIRELCTEIAKRCPNVSSLCIAKCYSRPLQQRLHPTLEECPSIDDLQPVLDGLKLEELAFLHEHPLVFREAKVEEVATKLKDIIFLELNPDPDYTPVSFDHRDFPSLKSLDIFGRLCPNLSKLSVYLDNTGVDLKGIKDPHPLPGLEELIIGGPGLADIGREEALLFLSKILYEGCTVESGTVNRDRGVPLAITQQRRDFWLGVHQQLPLLIRAREEEVKVIERLYKAIQRCEREIERCGGDVSVVGNLDEDEEPRVSSLSAPAASTPPPAAAAGDTEMDV
ncbi:hypothetical protein MD484_g5345, partial [Candolleomyces efflorescens]